MRNTYGIKIECQPQKIREFVDDFSTSKIPRVWLSDFSTSKNLEVSCQDFSTSKIPRVWLSDFWKSWPTVTLSHFRWESVKFLGQIFGACFCLLVCVRDSVSSAQLVCSRCHASLFLRTFSCLGYVFFFLCLFLFPFLFKFLFFFISQFTICVYFFLVSWRVCWFVLASCQRL